MTTFFLFILLIIGIGLILYLNRSSYNSPIMAGGANSTGTVQLGDILTDTAQANQELKTLVLKKQRGGSYDTNEIAKIKNLSEKNKQISDIVNTHKFEMSVAYIPPNLVPPVVDAYPADTGEAADLTNVLNQVIRMLYENNRLLRNIQMMAMTTPAPTLAPMVSMPTVAPEMPVIPELPELPVAPMPTTITTLTPTSSPALTNMTMAPPLTTTPVPTMPAVQVTTPAAPSTAGANDDRTRWLAIHNQLRQKHCAPNVIWNDQLANLAQQWANKLARDNTPFGSGRSPIPHPADGTEKNTYLTLRDASGNPINNGFQGQAGQNLAIGHSSEKTIENVTMDWYNEVNYPNMLQSNEHNLPEAQKQQILQQRLDQFYQSNPALIAKCGNNPILSYKYDKLPDCSPETGHFTQLVWKNTAEIGCASAMRPDGYVVFACNYNKPGNIYGYDDASTLSNFTSNVLNPANCS